MKASKENSPRTMSPSPSPSPAPNARKESKPSVPFGVATVSRVPRPENAPDAQNVPLPRAKTHKKPAVPPAVSAPAAPNKPVSHPRSCKKRTKKSAVPIKFSFSPRTKVRIEVRGLNSVRLLNALAEAGITVSDVKKYAADRISIAIDKKQARKTFAFCERMCYTYIVAGYEGLPAYLASLAKRAGVAVGCLAVLCCSFLLGGRCLKVETHGLDRTSRREVLAAVVSSGAGAGSRLSGIDRAAVRRAVNAVDGVAECSVGIRGTTLVVTVLESKAPSRPAPRGTAIVAACDAVVTRVVCGSGTARVKAGDVVSAGETLIEGAEYGSDGVKLGDVAAEGAVYGKATAKRTFVLATGGIINVRTGRSETRTVISIFGMRFGKRSSPYGSFESESTETVLNAFLPIVAVRTEYRETERRADERTIDELAAEYASRELAAFVDESASEARTVTHVEKIGSDLYEVTIYIEAEKKISAEETKG